MLDNGITRAEEIRKLQIIPELISHHLDKRGDQPALSQYNSTTKTWDTISFSELYANAEKWSRALVACGLAKGDRVSMLLGNSFNAVFFDQGALICGLVPVPLHIIDTAANCGFILQDSEAKFLVVMNRARWHAIRDSGADLSELKTVVFIDEEKIEPQEKDPKLLNLKDFLARGESVKELPPKPEPEDLACLVYTSGTTGKPKGVMLTHRNIMSDISALLYNIAPEPWDTWLSFLPLSHMFERTTTYYIGLGCGNHVTFSRGISRIVDDLKKSKPSLIMSVPRVYEKVNSKIQERLKTKSSIARSFFKEAVDAGFRRFEQRNGLASYSFFIRARDALMDPLYEKFVRKQIKDSFGGRIRVAVSGGAALSPDVSRNMIGLGIEIFQGYGMTETSPIISVNKIGANHPDTVGPVLPGIEVKLGDKDELLVRGPEVMRGYWKRPEDTAKTIDSEGFLATGDQADILPGNYLKIKGRIKEIIVTSTGEKVPPVDIEHAIENDPLFEQSMVIGENRPFITALVVLNKDEWRRLAESFSLDPEDKNSLENREVVREVLKHIKTATKALPQYGLPRAVKLLLDPWTIENGMLTPTLKIKRRIINSVYGADIEKLYENFGK